MDGGTHSTCVSIHFIAKGGTHSVRSHWLFRKHDTQTPRAPIQLILQMATIRVYPSIILWKLVRTPLVPIDFFSSWDLPGPRSSPSKVFPMNASLAARDVSKPTRQTNHQTNNRPCPRVHHVAANEVCTTLKESCWRTVSRRLYTYMHYINTMHEQKHAYIGNMNALPAYMHTIHTLHKHIHLIHYTHYTYLHYTHILHTYIHTVHAHMHCIYHISHCTTPRHITSQNRTSHRTTSHHNTSHCIRDIALHINIR